jgi:hypothetical protein
VQLSKTFPAAPVKPNIMAKIPMRKRRALARRSRLRAWFNAAMMHGISG